MKLLDRSRYHYVSMKFPNWNKVYNSYMELENGSSSYSGSMKLIFHYSFYFCSKLPKYSIPIFGYHRDGWEGGHPCGGRHFSSDFDETQIEISRKNYLQLLFSSQISKE